MQEPEHEQQHEPKSETATTLERLIVLSDGVFAIAITLLVLEIAAPSGTLSEAALANKLQGLIQPILTYALSFIVVSAYWVTHQRIFHYIKRADSGLIWLNILFLMSVAFLPIPTSVLSRYGDLRPAAIFYAAILTVQGLWIAWIWWYATNQHRLVDKQLDAGLIRHTLSRALIAPVVFGGSIALAFISPTVAEFSWLLVFVAVAVYERLYRRRTAMGVPAPAEVSPRGTP